MVVLTTAGPEGRRRRASGSPAFWKLRPDCTAGLKRVIPGPRRIYDKLIEELVPQVES